jgi:hypothetical protein
MKGLCCAEQRYKIAECKGGRQCVGLLKGLELSTKISADLVMLTDNESCLFTVELYFFYLLDRFDFKARSEQDQAIKRSRSNLEKVV